MILPSYCYARSKQEALLEAQIADSYGEVRELPHGPDS